jgi:tetratricopeptide (TPR) repeat protein
MKKQVFCVTILALAGLAFSAATPSMLAQESNGTITIKNPAEYNAYNSAIGQPTPQAKAQAIEAFLQQYPNSVVKKQMLEVLMQSYTQSGDTQKALDTAQKVLQVDPSNLRALALSTFVLRAEAQKKTNPSEAQPLLDQAAAHARKGLQAPPPTGADAANYNKIKEAVTPVFDGAIAQDELSKKNYDAAIQKFKAELGAMPPQQQTTGQGLQDTYLLGTAYVQKTPQDLVNGTWYLARAAAHAPEPFKDEIQKAAEYWYKKYHGSMDGFQQVQSQAAASLNPPAGFTITPAPPPPSPEQLAHTAVMNTPDLKTMALSDKEFVLQNGNDEDAAKVWDTMKGLTTRVPGKVISATPQAVQLAVSDDAQASNRADFTINMKEPLRHPPAINSMVQLVGTFDSYTKSPPMIIMKDGRPAEASQQAPARSSRHRR